MKIIDKAALALAFIALVAPRVSAAEEQGKAAKGEEVDDSKGEKTLPPVIEAAIAEKEKEVVGARQEGIRLLEDFLRSSAKSRETAEALYKLAELYWEESKASYLEKMGTYTAAVTACHKDRGMCPQ